LPLSDFVLEHPDFVAEPFVLFAALHRPLALCDQVSKHLFQRPTLSIGHEKFSPLKLARLNPTMNLPGGATEGFSVTGLHGGRRGVVTGKAVVRWPRRYLVLESRSLERLLERGVPDELIGALTASIAVHTANGRGKQPAVQQRVEPATRLLESIRKPPEPLEMTRPN